MATSRTQLLAVTSLGHFVNDGTTFFVPIVAALLTSHQYGISPEEILAVLVVFYAASATLSPLVGRLSDRTGRPAALMAVGMACMGAGLVGFYGALALLVAPEAFTLALLSALLVGFGAAFYHPLGATLLQSRLEGQNLGLALGINGAMGSAGRTLYPFLFFIVGLWLFPDSSLLLFAAVAIFAFLLIGRTASTLHLDPGAGTVVDHRPAHEALTTGILLLTGIAFVRSAANLGVVGWLPTYLSNGHGPGFGLQLGLEVTIMYVGGILGQPFFGKLADRVDARLLLGLSSVGSALATLGFLAFTGLGAMALLFLIGFFTFSAFPLLMTLSAEHVDRRSTSLANALVFGLGSGAGGVLGPVIVGVLNGGSYSNPTGFYAMIALGIFAGVAVVAIPSSTKRKGPVTLFS